MKTQEQLKDLNKAELKEYGTEIGADTKGNLSEDTLIQRIMDKQLSPDFQDPNPAPEIQEPLEGREVMEPTYTLDSGPVKTGGEVLEAAFRDSGLERDEWNELTDTKRQAYLQAFVDKTNFVAVQEAEEAPTPKGDKKRVEALMADEFPEIGFEVEENFWTMTYAGQIKSGNITISDNTIRREASVMVSND